MCLSVVGSFYLCFKIKEFKQREWQQQLEPCACVQIHFIHKTREKNATAAEQLQKKKIEQKSTGPSELMNNDATKEIRSVGGLRNAQA